MLTAFTVRSFPAAALAPVAAVPENAHALVHAGVGFAQVHRALGLWSGQNTNTTA